MWPAWSAQAAIEQRKKNYEINQLVESIAMNPKPAIHAIDLTKAKAGDVVHFRCGGYEKIISIKLNRHLDWFSIKFAGTECDISYLLNGQQNDTGKHPFDIIRLEPAPTPAKEYRLEDMWVIWFDRKPSVSRGNFHFSSLEEARKEIGKGDKALAITKANAQSFFEGENLA